MDIGVIGAGMIGGTVGGLWAKAGHRVRFATRHPQSLGPLIAEAGPNASAGSPEEAARFGEVVFCSVPCGAWPSLAPAIAPLVAGKVVLDCANPYPRRDGDFARQGDRRRRGRRRPGGAAPVRRPFGAGLQLGLLQDLADRGAPGRRPRRHPARGRRSGGARHRRASRPGRGFEPVVVGPLASARFFDPGTPVYNTGMSGADVARALGRRPYAIAQV